MARLIPRPPPAPVARPSIARAFPIWPIALIPILLVVAVVVQGRWERSNSDLLGWYAPDLDALTLSSGLITDGERRWEVVYEDGPGDYQGVVKWAVPWRDADWPFFTHDILLVTGDFADPEKVTLSVQNHVVFAKSMREPSGTMAMVHAVTVDPAIYARLLEVRVGREVRAIGREILTVTRIDENGENLGFRTDRGCKTMLIERVEIK